MGYLALRRGLLALTMAVAVSALVLPVSGAAAQAASAARRSKPRFRPRVGHGMGLIPTVNSRRGHQTEPSEGGIYTPLTYHGGPTMTGGVTVHAIFWAPAGYAFMGAPPGSQSYEGLIEQYLGDVAASSTGTSGAPCTPSACNVFTALPQYAWGTGPGATTSGQNTLLFNPATDVILDNHAFPKRACTSPADDRGCLTDAQVQAEVDRIVQATSGQPRGLHNLWYVFLPPNVDECLVSIECGTDAFAGYHSVSNVQGHGLTVYAVGIDPIIELGQTIQGGDPEGNPDAELAIDIVAHEVNEAITDPEGTGWMDPNGYEIGDKCEFGPARGTLLGYASDGSPYNQVLGGNEYLVQEMWSNNDNGCAQGTTHTKTTLPLPQVYLRQFSSQVSGNTENNTPGIKVRVRLLRSDGGQTVVVASGAGVTSANGSWSVTLSGGHAVGDDRDKIEVGYAGPSAPRGQVILTGNGGDPMFGSGWTGWSALDAGFALRNHDTSQGGGPSLTLSPCSQTGELSYSGAPGPSPEGGYCSLKDVADIPLSAPVSPAQHVALTSLDDRAFAPRTLPTGAKLASGGNLRGALVALTVRLGEADAAPGLNAVPPSGYGYGYGGYPGSPTGSSFTPTGMPTCSADLSQQSVLCSGLLAGEKYTLTHRLVSGGSQVLHVRADQGGSIFDHMAVKGGDSLALANPFRTLTTLHVARLRVHIVGNNGGVQSGICSPGEYWGGLQFAQPSFYAGLPTSAAGGSALTGQICPLNGNAQGLPVLGQAVELDERSGGETTAELANVGRTIPLSGETMYGSFTARAQSVGPGDITLTIATHHGKTVLRLGRANAPDGVRVKGLAPGSYVALWGVRDANGDTRTVSTTFTEHRLGHHR